MKHQIRQVVDPIILRLKEELYGKGNSFGPIASGILPTTVVYYESDGSIAKAGIDIVNSGVEVVDKARSIDFSSQFIVTQDTNDVKNAIVELNPDYIGASLQVYNNATPLTHRSTFLVVNDDFKAVESGIASDYGALLSLNHQTGFIPLYIDDAEVTTKAGGLNFSSKFTVESRNVGLVSAPIIDLAGELNKTHTGEVYGDEVLTIASGVVTAAKLNDMGAVPGQVLLFNGTQWAPGSVTSSSINDIVDYRIVGSGLTETTSPAYTVALLGTRISPMYVKAKGAGYHSHHYDVSSNAISPTIDQRHLFSLNLYDVQASGVFYSEIALATDVPFPHNASVYTSKQKPFPSTKDGGVLGIYGITSVGAPGYPDGYVYRLLNYLSLYFTSWNNPVTQSYQDSQNQTHTTYGQGYIDPVYSGQRYYPIYVRETDFNIDGTKDNNHYALAWSTEERAFVPKHHSSLWDGVASKLGTSQDYVTKSDVLTVNNHSNVVASSTTLGHIKLGNGIHMTASGQAYIYPVVIYSNGSLAIQEPDYIDFSNSFTINQSTGGAIVDLSSTKHPQGIATNTTLGHIKIGNNLTIDIDGTLHATGGGGGVSSPLTTTGDLWYYNNGIDSRLPIGAEDKVLTVKNGIPSWETASSGSGGGGSTESVGGILYLFNNYT